MMHIACAAYTSCCKSEGREEYAHISQFAGREVRESMFNQVADLFHDLDMGMLPISVLFPYLPIPAHWARDR